MMFRSAAAALCLILLAAPAASQQQYRRATPERLKAAEQDLARYTSPRLTRFASDDEFRRYLGAVLALQRARNGWYASAGTIQFAQADTQGDVQSDAVEPICPETDPACAEVQEQDAGQDSSESITVTGSRIGGSARASTARPASSPATNGQITNNQMRGVEEGDIVKQIDHFLLVLQDGRIFVVDTRGGGTGGRRLMLADRANVYRDAYEQMWYDEMLVFGDRILVTGYSYRQNATELSVFRLSPQGRLSREGVFYMSSNDYYSSTNYATRLIGDNLVVYTPFNVSHMASQSFVWPVVRRWTAGEPSDARLRSGRPLFDATQVYRPVQNLRDPTVHTVSVCPLGRASEAGRNLECRSTAFVGPNTAQWYVTDTDAFLWTTDRIYSSYDPQSCDAPASFENGFEPALVYRTDVEGGGLSVLGARGNPPDQFALHASGEHLRALLKERQRYCQNETAKEVKLSYFDVPLRRFGDTLVHAERSSYSPLPGVGSHYLANRFTDRYLVYGSIGQERRGLSAYSTPPVYVVPAGRPQSARSLPVRHSLIRAEQAGDDFVVTGYRDQAGLFVTLIDLDGRPRIASSIRLEQRFESEGRSHAFNSLIEADGTGVMGLPTISGENRSSRAAWRSSSSDLSFVTVDRDGDLKSVGELEHRFRYARSDNDEDGIPGYKCEVSCIDWYGNSRPIFTDGRVFALTGTEMIEGRIAAGAIYEVQRINIARPRRAQMAANIRP
jgi:hypothetical protein